jgi:hypothetical protein
MYFADDALIVTNPELSSCRYMIYLCIHVHTCADTLYSIFYEVYIVISVETKS